jgi:hypothetical protein
MIGSMSSYHITEWQAYFTVKKKLDDLKNDFSALQKQYHRKATGK